MSYQDQNIYVIGMPGSGKTTLGKALARELNRPFTDLDQAIEQAEQQSIRDIFRNQGEQTFRQLETRYLQQISSLQQLQVISTGGGTPCFHDNMDYINEMGISVYLEVPEEILAARLLAGPQDRPLLQGKKGEELLEFLGELLNQRKPYYRRATLVLSGIEINASHILESLQTL